MTLCTEYGSRYLYFLAHDTRRIETKPQQETWLCMIGMLLERDVKRPYDINWVHVIVVYWGPKVGHILALS